MNSKVKFLLACYLLTACLFKAGLAQHMDRKEQYRPQIHFSPRAGWMNDPNGMVYLNGQYHLFYQHNPKESKWGFLSWGHATSKDLIHWQDQPVAISPDSLGWIFSGSSVYDKDNTSGLGKNGKGPLVAIYTQHNIEMEKAGRNDFQYQSLAYSLDEGKTWIKYSGNPVLKSPGIRDFRDPKVIWDTRIKKWIMMLAVQDRISFYSSPDLKTWSKESDFGQDTGAHGGVWECPDLFPLTLSGKTYWVLLVSINPGGPNGGSATQYFIGDFDGKTFKPHTNDIRWLDWGADNYAGVTWANTGDRKLLIGWMSNWQYAQDVPTETWRSAYTIPRELSLAQAGNSVYLCSRPVKELDDLSTGTIKVADQTITQEFDLSDKVADLKGTFRVSFRMKELTDFSLVLSNEEGEEVVIGFDKERNQYFIDRSRAGKSDFSKDFAARHTAPRISTAKSGNLDLIVDVVSVELFADGGLNAMTDIAFPKTGFNRLKIVSKGNLPISNLKITGLKSIW